MANEHNLVSLADRPKEERIEIARKGGIASGVERRRKRDLRIRINVLWSDYETKQGTLKGYEIIEKIESGEADSLDDFFDD